MTAQTSRTGEKAGFSFELRSLSGLVIPVLLIGLWEFCGQMGVLPRYLVAPSAIFTTMWDMAREGELLEHMKASLFRQSIGFTCGAAMGSLIGLLAGAFGPIGRFYEPIVSTFYPVPKVALLPLIFVWFGIGDLSKIIVMTISIFFPTYLAAYYGARSVRKIYIWTAQNAGASRVRILFRVIAPSALPEIFNGLRIGLALSFVLMVTTELVVSKSGLGYVVGRAEETLRFDRMYVAIIVIGMLGFCADRALLAIRKRAIVGQLLGKEHG
jgi:ABC-type nitrate/sulfonate/bicarbonate transport system permease component